MKNLLRSFLLSPFSFLLLSVFCLLFSSCGEQRDIKVAAKGGMNEIFAVVKMGDSVLTDTLRSIFAAPVEMINQYEPQFDLLVIPPKSFSPAVASHRNLLLVQLDPALAEPRLVADYDRDAAPQIVVTLAAPSAASAIAYADAHRTELRHIFRMAERDRDIAYIARHRNEELSELVEEKFGLHIDIPDGYKLRTQSENFVWISHERPSVSQGILIYDYPYAGLMNFDSISPVLHRNQFAQRIPGPSDGSFMTTLTADFYPITDQRTINGRHWARTRGFWEVEGDFMGGPFVAYTTLNPTTGRVNTIDFYLHSPRLPKRNFLWQLEHIIYSVNYGENGERASRGENGTRNTEHGN